MFRLGDFLSPENSGTLRTQTLVERALLLYFKKPVGATSLNGGGPEQRFFLPGDGNAASIHRGAVLAKSSNCWNKGAVTHREGGYSISRATLGN